MRFTVDRMTMADVPRVIEIERLSYPSPWPPSAYKKELQENRHAHYIVVRDETLRSTPPPQTPEPPRRAFPMSLLPARTTQPLTSDAASIVGFAGLWLMVDESHITTIAVHPAYRGLGLGEMLLNSLIGISFEIGARIVTLEVRVSNTVAQNLYEKYGFKKEGIRRRYYSDNHEDAYIMSTGTITDPAYRQRFTTLRQTLEARLLAEDQNAASEPQQP